MEGDSIRDDRTTTPAARGDELPQVVLVGLYPKSLRRAADCLVYSDRFVFVGISRKSVLKRMVGTAVTPLDPAAIPMALIMTVASKAAEQKMQPLSKELADKYQLTPELAEALQNSKTIRFVDIKNVSFPWYSLSAYAVNVEMVDGSKERLLPSQTYAKKDFVKQVFKGVLGDKVSA
ncbi:MAG: hypothetical protein E6I24_09985 [Chloroflexi bacterium]|nr:MAG: hypothetical protein E6I24_09985 [Chloroflexota bacterium]